MRIYLAARYSRRHELQGYREQLVSVGHVVTSRWLWEEHDLPIGGDPGMGVRFALDDTEDLCGSECVIAFTEEPGVILNGRGRGGRHVEFGMALALGGMRVIIVGWRENVFHYLPQVEFHSTWSKALAALSESTS